MRQTLISGIFGATFLVAFTSGAIADVTAGLTALDAGDAQTAASEFQASYEAGDGDGAFYLGRLFELGVGTDKDLNRAANLYAAGAERGSVQAMNRLGLMYLEGTTLLRDYAAAKDQFCKAADLGDQNGQLN
ncbi:MAG: tetratricopeptide repeat protein [Maritimibacter sp.]